MQPTKIEISNRLHIRLALSMLNGQPTELLRRMMRIVDPKAPATLKRIREVANILGMNTLDVVKPLTSDEVEWAAIAIAAGRFVQPAFQFFDALGELLDQFAIVHRLFFPAQDVDQIHAAG